MRWLLTAGLVAAALPGCGSTHRVRDPPLRAAGLWPAPERYDVHASWDQGRHRLSGTMDVTLRNSGPAPLAGVWLRAWPNAFGSCAHPLAQVEVVSGGRAGGRRAGCTAYEVRLARALVPGARTTVGLRFGVAVPAHADRFGRTRDVAFLGNALPILAVADRDGWRLPPYFDQGEAWFSLTSAWHVQLAVPAGLTVASTGTESSPGVYEAPRARDFTLVIGRMRTETIRVGDITVRHFRPPGRPASDATRALAAARESLLAYSRWYGPYGRPELDVVQGPAHIATRGIAMEYPELVLTPPAGAAVAHEIAHQWFAFLMGNDPYREPFLDESFAEFSAARLPRRVTGGNRLRGCPKPRRPPPIPLSSDVPAIQRAGGRTFVRVIYIGGACTLRRLERALGTARFEAMLRKLVAAHRDATWTRDDLIAGIRAAAPQGFDVDAFLIREGIRSSSA